MSKTINIFLTSALISLATTSNFALLSNVYAQDHTTYGPVKSGELIWSIAGKVTPKDAAVSRQQVIMGILHANPDAFKVPCNFNSLKVGETLNIPALTDIQAKSQEAAKQEFDQQNEAWKNRKKTPIVCPPAAETPPASATAPTDTPKTAEASTPAAPTPPSAPAEATPPKEVTPAAPQPGEATTPPPPPPAAPPTAPPAPPVAEAPKPAEATPPPPPAASPPPPEAPKLVADNVAPPPPAAPPSSSAPATPSTASTEASSPKRTTSNLPDLIIWLLIGGGLLSALIIAGLIQTHARRGTTSMATAPNSDNYDFAGEPNHTKDDMPLHTRDKVEVAKT